MDLYETCENLINESKKKLEKYDSYREHSGMDSNIFTVLGMERDEVNTHSSMLYSICKSYSKNRYRDSFIKMLLAKIDLPESFQNETWEVEREHFTKFGRIDLFLRSKRKSKGMTVRCIVIEIKIDACDQDRQLKRYEEYAKSNYDDYRILYLTLDGKEPIEQSFREIAEGKFNRISFKAHIRPWLVQCIEEFTENGIDCSFIRQYEILLEKLVGENQMQNDIKNLIHSSTDLLAGMEIAKSIEAVKNEITNNFMKAIKQEFISQGYAVLAEYNEDKSKSNKEVCKCLGFEIKKFKLGDKILYFSIGIEIETYLFYYIGFYEKINDEMVFIDINEVSDKHKRFYNSCAKTVQQAIGEEIRENSYSSMYWKNIKDKEGQIYDFKHFSVNCADLMETYKEEAERIATETIIYLERIKDLLSDN